MQVVINSAHLPDLYSREYINFISSAFERIANKHPEHTFIFLCKQQDRHLFTFAKNIQVHAIKQSSSNLLLWKYWYDVKIPAILRKHKADLFITGGGFCSLTTRVNQYMIIQDLSFLHFPSFYTKTQGLFYKRYTKKFVNKAKRIITLSFASKNDIINSYAVDDNKIDVVYNGLNEIFKPATDEISKEVKEKYTEGKNFFLYCGPTQPAANLTNLLKAFSLFKKRQQSSMKLLLCTATVADKSFKKSLLTYKYRNDIVVLENTDEAERSKLVSSSYAMICPAYFDGFYSATLEAFKCSTPIIASNNLTMHEIAGDSALYADSKDHTAIAEQIMHLYKDENKRNELIKSGNLLGQQYNWDKTAELLWLSIQNTVL